MDEERAKLQRAFLADPSNTSLAERLWHWTQRSTPILKGRTLEAWFKDLESTDWTVRFDATSVLKTLGSGVLWPVQELLDHASHNTRWDALIILEHLGPASWMTFPRLKEQIYLSRNSHAVARVIACLGRPEAFDFLHQIIANEVRQNIVTAALAGFTANTKLGPSFLSDYLSNERRFVVEGALEMLGHMGPAAKDEIPKILPFVNSPTVSFKKLAKRAVKRLVVAPPSK